MTKKLKDSIVKNAKTKADGKPADYADGEGLRLHVTTSGKYWHYRYRWDGKGKELSLGTYPTVSLKEARERHEEAKGLLARGINPRSYRKQMKAAKAELNSRSFQAIALEWLARSLPTWSESHAVRVQRYLEKDVFPALGVMQINEVKPADIIRVVQRVEARGAGDAARRVKQYIHQVYTYAVTLELAERNPAADIDNNIILKPRTKKHFATLTDPVKIGQLLGDMDDYQGSVVALRTMGYDNQMITSHGFRGMASSLLNELGWNPDAIERQLAHKKANQIRAAYIELSI
ncbi:MAG: DUF4102 domain-containing protein [Thiothrix sp.]|nr:MAG: DUF4102 domain-containing protein [Thiothrix sp.]